MAAFQRDLVDALDGMGSPALSSPRNEASAGGAFRSPVTSNPSQHPFSSHAPSVAHGGGGSSGGNFGRPARKTPQERFAEWEAARKARQQRLAESALREEKEACTFQPNVDRSTGSAHNVSAEDLSAGQERFAEWDAARKARQQELAEAAIREEVDECTFRPNIGRSASAASATNSGGQQHVQDRLLERARESAAQRRRLVEQAEAAVQQQCTFKPDIRHPTATSAAAGHDQPSPISMRSHGPSAITGGDASQTPPARNAAAAAIGGGVRVFEYIPVEERTTQSRLHHFFGSDYHDRRDEECTFHPTVTRAAQQVYHDSRVDEGNLDVYTRLYNRSAASLAERRGASPDRRQGASTAVALQGAMPAAVLDELGVLRAQLGTYPSDDDTMACFFSNLLGTSAPPMPRSSSIATRSASGGGGRSPSPPVAVAFDQDGLPVSASTAARSRSAAATDDSGVPGNTRYVRFNEFIARQNELEERKREGVAKLRAETDPRPPQLCENSIRILARKGDDSARNHTARSASASVKGTNRPPAGYEECSFTPRIEPRAAAHPSRGPDDMLRDATRRSNRIAQLRRERDQAQQAGMTFAPARHVPIPKDLRSVKATLAKDNLDDYLRSVQVKQKRRQQVKRKEDARRQEAEDAACTFKPQRNVVPGYIHDMARSAHVLRGAMLFV